MIRQLERRHVVVDGIGILHKANERRSPCKEDLRLPRMSDRQTTQCSSVQRSAKLASCRMSLDKYNVKPRNMKDFTLLSFTAFSTAHSATATERAASLGFSSWGKALASRTKLVIFLMDDTPGL